MGEKVSAELLAMRMDHARGRRAVLVGDVLQDGDRTALVVHVDAEPERWNLPINRGTATLERDLDGRKRYTERRLETLSAMPLVRVGDFVDRSKPAKHRYGVREIQIGDVFADPDDREREVVVVEFEGQRAVLGWLGTGRTSHRLVESLRRMALVRWAP